MFEAITVSSLSKVFPNERPLYPLQSGSCFYNEVYSFQLAFHGDFKRRVRLRVQTEGLSVTVRTVELVPSFMAQNYEFCDDYTIKKGDTSGYYPDLLLPVGEEGISLHPYLWQSVWITVRPQYAGKKRDRPGNLRIRKSANASRVQNIHAGCSERAFARTRYKLHDVVLLRQPCRLVQITAFRRGIRKSHVRIF